MNENKRLTKSFFTLLAKHTSIKIDLFYLSETKLKNRDKGKRIRIAKEIPIPKAYEILMNDNAVWKNSPFWQDRYNVYFAPSKEQDLNIAFVDDLQNIERFIQKKHFCLVQTSEEKYQGYFLLNEYCTPERILQIQRRLCEVYKGDKGALSPYQLRRVPGFYNTKYVIDFLVRTVFVGSTVVDVGKIKEDNTGVATASAVAGGVSFFNPFSPQELNNLWYFYLDKANGDKSSADFSFCMALLKKGYSSTDVERYLLQYSEDIEKRKGKWLEDYVNRTVRKAQEYLRQSTGYSKF